MAGTIVADTIQDGAGNSTAMDNAIYGSAKAWVRYAGTSGGATINASYNVSSLSRVAAGQYTINFTNALTDANYAVVGMATWTGGPYIMGISTGSVPTSSSVQITSGTTGGSNTDIAYNSVAIFR